MKLSDYIKEKQIEKRELASRIGVSFTSLGRYLAGTRRPEWNVMARIARVTGGQVMPNDFLDEAAFSSDEPEPESREDEKAA